MNPNPAKLAGFDLEDKATNEILPNWQDLKLLGYVAFWSINVLSKMWAIIQKSGRVDRVRWRPQN